MHHIHFVMAVIAGGKVNCFCVCNTPISIGAVVRIKCLLKAEVCSSETFVVLII